MHEMAIGTGNQTHGYGMDYDGPAGLKVQLRNTVVEEDGRANRMAPRRRWRRFESCRGLPGGPAGG